MKSINEAMQIRVIAAQIVMREHNEQDADPFGDVDI